MRWLKLPIKFFIQLLISYTLIFVVLHASGGDPLASDLPISTSYQAQLRQSLHLDAPLAIQYLYHLKSLFTLSTTYSFFYHITPLSTLFFSALLTSLLTALPAFLLAISLAIVLAASAYAAPHRPLRRLFSYLIITLGSLPTLITAPLTFFLLIQLQPQLFSQPSLWYAWPWLFIIISLFVLPYSATFAKIIVSQLNSEPSYHDLLQYRALGFSSMRILWLSKLRFILPILQYSGMAAAQLLAGSMLIEDFFRIPGLGMLSVQAILRRDYPTILLTALFFSLCLSLLTQITQSLHQKLNPKQDLL